MTGLWFVGAVATLAVLVYLILTELEGDDHADRG